MHLLLQFKLYIVILLMITQVLFVPTTYLDKSVTCLASNKISSKLLLINKFNYGYSIKSPTQNSRLKILGPNKEPNPVVNEGNQLQLQVVDENNLPITDVRFESGSPEIAAIDSQTGMVRGIERGFATITARRNNGEISSEFLVVTRITKNKGVKIPGEITQDTSNKIYLSDPQGRVILRKTNLNAQFELFAGHQGIRGSRDGSRQDALFAGPTAIAVDNRANGGIFVADTLNHSIRKINFADQVTTILGTGQPGITLDDITPFERVAFNSPQGIAVNSGGNLFIVDTNNHAIYLADLEKKQLYLIAGQPGVAGKLDGTKREARFNRPTAISVQSAKTTFFSQANQQAILVADTGNNIIRLVTLDGKVTTLGSIAKTANNFSFQSLADNELVFNEPTSITSDGLGNIYVVDKTGVKVITTPANRDRKVISLAQAGVSFTQATSLVTKGSDVLVLDANPTLEEEVVKVVSVGAPEITDLSQDSAPLLGNTVVTIKGKNFAPESLVVLGDSVVTSFTVISATEIRFQVPPQNAPGNRTLSILTRGGVTQHAFAIIPKTLSELSSGEITTVAGGVSFIGDGGKAIFANLSLGFFFSFGSGIALDGKGNIFIADANNNRVRQIDINTGIITTVAGNGGVGFSGDGGLATSAKLNLPIGVALDSAGNLFIVERNNSLVRRVDAVTKIITTVAGGGQPPDSLGDGALATDAALSEPTAIAIDTVGNLYISDSSNNRVRKVEASTSIIRTVAGNGKEGFSGDGELATLAKFSLPRGLAIDSQSNLYIADLGNSRIRRVDAQTGIITTVAGNGTTDRLNIGDGNLATNASVNLPSAIAFDGKENLFIADTENRRIRRVDQTTKIITTVAGTGDFGFAGDGGLAINATFTDTCGLGVDGTGNIFIVDQFNRRIRRVDSNGQISTIAGSESVIGDGMQAIKANLNFPTFVALDSNDNLFISDTGNLRVRKVDTLTNTITTIAGNGSGGFSGDGGLATQAQLGFLFSGVALDSNGNLFIMDTDNVRIRRVDSSGIISTFAGSGEANFSGDGGLATACGMAFPRNIAIDQKGNVFIADLFNNRVRRIDAQTAIITTVAGNGSKGFRGDGGSALMASLNEPFNVALDLAGNLFIADSGNSRVRRVDVHTGIITTVAGNGQVTFSGDGGLATKASLADIIGLAVDSNGNLFITTNNRIRKVDAVTNIITTIAGNGEEAFIGDGGQATNASFFAPGGIAIDSLGNIYVADSFNSAIRVVKDVAAKRSSVLIADVTFNKPSLVINGVGFRAEAKVSINDLDVSKSITSITSSQITLKGNKKKLNLKKGVNTITITENGIISNVFSLTL